MDTDFNEKVIQINQAARLLKTLSNEQRLFILCALGEKEMNVSKLVETTKFPQTSVSQHLSRLRLEGYVTSKREGKNVIYKLNSDIINETITLLQKYYCS